MTDPLTAAELEALRKAHAEGRAFGAGLGVEARLLATLDAERERFVGVLLDMRHKGVIVLDREKWRRYVPDGEGERWIAYVPFASMLPGEVDAHYAAHPEARERDAATVRRLYAERFPDGSKLRDMAEQGTVTSGADAAQRAWLALPRHERLRARFPGSFDEMRAMVRAAAETSEEKP